MKKKGAFVWGMNVPPTYAWYNGTHRRYLLGDTIDPAQRTWLTEPTGHIRDPRAKIYPFKIHNARQISDAENKYLVVPHLWGGFWKHFDWGKAAEDGMRAAGLSYSGRYEFVDTGMYWAINHEVVPREQALNCVQCHTANDAVSCSRCHTDVAPVAARSLEQVYRAMTATQRGPAAMDFPSLGYDGDPAQVGGRFSKLPASSLETNADAAPADASSSAMPPRRTDANGD